MDMKKPVRRARVLISKIGLDGHNRGAYVVAHGLRQAGMEVVYTGIRQTPASVAKAALEEAVDVIGISSMVGAHLSIVKKLRRELDAINASDIPIIIGGIIPEEDYEELFSLGAEKIFLPGSEVRSMVAYIQGILEGPRWVPEVPGSLVGKDHESLRLMGTRCEKCGRVYFPSRRNCPRCMDDKRLKQFPLEERGILKSFVVAEVAPPGFDVPHAQGYVDLAGGGPTVFSLLVDYGDRSRLQIGCPMCLKIVERGRDQENRIIFGYRFRPL